MMKVNTDLKESTTSFFGRRRIVLNIVYFFCILYLGDRGIAFLINRNVIECSNFRYSRLYQGDAKADILLIGNSRGLAFYQPHIEELTSMSSFNLSYNGLPTNLAVVLLQDYITKNGKPKLLILEGTMFSNRKEIVANFGCYSHFSGNLQALIDNVSAKMGKFNRAFNLTKYNGEVFQRAMFFINKPDTGLINDRVISQKKILGKLGRKEKHFDTEACKDYQKMVKLCKANNIQVKIVINPYFPKYCGQMLDFETYKKLMERETGEHIYDFATALPHQDMFADFFHVNKKGSIELMNIFDKQNLFGLK